MTVYRNLNMPGVAWVIDGPEQTWTWDADEGDWLGPDPTGLVIAHMVGDDRPHSVDPDDLVPIEDDDYCSQCGQLGCGHG